MAFFNTPGTELLYSGEARITPSAATMASFSAATSGGMPRSASSSALNSGMPWSVRISSVDPAGTTAAAALRRAVLNESRRRLPEMPRRAAIREA